MDLKSKIKNSNLAVENLKEYTEAELSWAKSADTEKDLNSLKVEILDLDRRIKTLKAKPTTCPTCGQTMPDIHELPKEISILELKKEELSTKFVKKEKRFEITRLKESIFKTKYTLEDISIMLNSIKLKDKYLRLQELKDVEEPKEQLVSDSYLDSTILDFKHDLSIKERLEEYKDISLPKPIQVKKFSQIIEDLTAKEHELNKKLNSIEQSIETKKKNYC